MNVKTTKEDIVDNTKTQSLLDDDQILNEGSISKLMERKSVMKNGHEKYINLFVNERKHE